MTNIPSLTTAERTPEDADAALRPKTLDEFVGQQAARENLRVFIAAAKSRGEALDHVLFFGPPGLGKTTLAQIMATSCSLMKFTGFPLRLRKCSTPPWKIARSTS